MILHKNLIFNGEIEEKVLQEVIKKRYKDKLIQKKLALLDEVSDSFHGLFTEVDSKSVRIKHAVEQYNQQFKVD